MLHLYFSTEHKQQWINVDYIKTLRVLSFKSITNNMIFNVNLSHQTPRLPPSGYSPRLSYHLRLPIGPSSGSVSNLKTKVIWIPYIFRQFEGFSPPFTTNNY